MPEEDPDLDRPARTRHGYATEHALDALGDLLGPDGSPDVGTGPGTGDDAGPDETPPEPRRDDDTSEAHAGRDADDSAPGSEDPSAMAGGATEAEAAPEPAVDAALRHTVQVEAVPLEVDRTATTPSPGFRPKGKNARHAGAKRGPDDEAAPGPDGPGRPQRGPAAPAPATPPGETPTAVAPRQRADRGPAPLVPQTPSLGLSDLLQRDAVMNVPKWRAARAGLVAAALFGLLLAVIGAARHRAGIDADLLGPLRIGHIGLIITMLAAWGYLTVRTVAGDRVLRIPLAPSQGDQWEEVQSQARLMQFGQWVGAGGSVLGLLLLAAALRYMDGAGLALAAGMGGILAVASLALIGFMEARRGPLRAVYVQTLLLSRLEQAGVSEGLAMDPRTAQVLQALDKLLADLPESSVRKFLGSQEAQWYLDLIETSRGGGDD